MRYRPHRYPTDYPIMLRVGNTLRKCKLFNINNTGAGITGVDGVDLGDFVLLDYSVGQVRALVKWAQGDRLGVYFRPPLALQAVDRLRHASVPTMRQQSHRLRMREMR